MYGIILWHVVLQEVTVKSDVVSGVHGEWYLPKADGGGIPSDYKII